MLYEKWIKDWRAALAENFFLRSAVILLAAGLILNATVFRENNRIVIVPPTLQTEFWIEKGKASPEYLEQMTVFIATLAGNLAPRNAEYNINSLMGYIDHERLRDVKDDLRAEAMYIKKNNITQSFFPESTNIDEKDQSATVDGVVTRHVGAIKVSEERMRVSVRYKFKDYSMKVMELSVDYPGRKARDKKKDEEATAPVTGETVTQTTATAKKEAEKKKKR